MASCRELLLEADRLMTEYFTGPGLWFTLLVEPCPCRLLRMYAYCKGKNCGWDMSPATYLMSPSMCGFCLGTLMGSKGKT